MGFTLNTGSYKDWANKNAKPFAGYSSVEENFAASVGQVVDEELSVSSLLWDNNSDERNRNILNLAEDGQIDQSTLEMFKSKHPGGRGTKTDYNALAEYLNETGTLSEHLDTDEDLDKIRNDELASRRTYRNKIFDTALTGGKVAQFAGGFVASGLDPINVATMGFAAPVAGARAVSKSMYALSMAGRGAALNVGVSIPIEPFIHSWKEEIGAGETYTIADSLFNIGASGVLGGTVSGIAAAIGRRFTGDSILNKDYDSLITHFKKAGLDEDDAETMARFVDEANQVPDKEWITSEDYERLVRAVPELKRKEDYEALIRLDPNMSARDFVETTEATQERMDKGFHIDKDSESEINIDDVESLDAMYEEVPKDMEILREDGSRMTAQELDAEIDAELEFFKSKLGCLSGK